MDHNLAAADTVKFNFLSFFIKNKIMSLIFFLHAIISVALKVSFFWLKVFKKFLITLARI